MVDCFTINLSFKHSLKFQLDITHGLTTTTATIYRTSNAGTVITYDRVYIGRVHTTICTYIVLVIQGMSITGLFRNPGIPGLENNQSLDIPGFN